MKHIFRIGLVVMLMAAMLLCAMPVYADGGGDGEVSDPGDEGNPGDGGLNVNVTVVGDNADVGVDLYGDDNTASVEFHSENPTVYINGQDINQPTVIHKRSGASRSWVERKISEVLGPVSSWAGETQTKIALTADALAKVILTIRDQDSQLGDTSADVGELYAELDGVYTQLQGIDSDLASLDSRHDSLESRQDSLAAEVRANQQELLFEIEMLEWEHNRRLAIMAGAFLLVVMGLGLGFGISIHRLRKRIIG